MVMTLEAIPGRNANVPRDEEFDETAEVTEQIQQVAPSVFPDNPTREVTQRGDDDATGNSQGVQSHIASTSGARNLEGNNGIHNERNPGSVRSTVVRSMVPHTSPEFPTREVAQRGADDATGNSQGVQHHITLNQGTRNLERRSAVSRESPSNNPRSIESTGSDATNHYVTTTAILALSVAFLGVGLQLDNSIVSMASAVSILTALTWASFGELCSNMLNSFGRMLSYADEPKKRFSDLLEILGFTQSEVDSFIDIVCIETIDGIGGLQEDECMDAFKRLLIGDFRARRLSLGLCAFQQYYTTFVKEKVINGQSVGYSNAFSVSNYDKDVHNNVVDNYSAEKERQAAFNELEEAMMKPVTGIPPDNVVLKEINSSVSPFQGSQNVHQIGRQRNQTSNTNESEMKDVDSIISIPITEKGLVPLEFRNGMSSNHKSHHAKSPKKRGEARKKRTKKSPNKQTSNTNESKKKDVDAKSPKKRGGAKKKRTKKGTNNESGDESPSSSSVSLSDSNDPEEEFDPFSGSAYFRLSDFSGLKLPQFPVSDATCKTWCRNFMTKTSVTGAHLLISKSNRIMKPSRKVKANGGMVKGEPAKAFNKRLRAWTKRDNQILLVIREIANNSNHYISREFDRFTSGVEAYDFLLTKMSPQIVDPTSSNTDMIERLTTLKLVSVNQGGFIKFLSLFQEAISDLTDTGEFTPSEDYQKSLLISKLPEEYHPMTVPSATRVGLDQYLLDLQAFSVAIEKNRSEELYHESLVLNASSDKSSDHEKVIDSILGIPINEKGFIPYHYWVTMTEDERTTFLEKKQALVDDENVVFKMNPLCEENDDTSEDPSEDPSEDHIELADMNYGELQDLVKHLLESKKKSGSDTEDDDSNSSDDRDATVNNLSTMFPKMSKENQKKVMKFCKKKVKKKIITV
jgi:hypothetical protein